MFYYKSSQTKEVDFVLEKQGRIKQIIQVCADISDFATKQRELKSLLRASQELTCNNLLILTSDYEAEEKAQGKKIRYLPLWKWLMEEERN